MVAVPAFHHALKFGVVRLESFSPILTGERGHVDCVSGVVRAGVQLDYVNDLGWTAFLEAVILGDGGGRHQEIVRILFDAGVDPTVADHDGVTALAARPNGPGYGEIGAIHLSEADGVVLVGYRAGRRRGGPRQGPGKTAHAPPSLHASSRATDSGAAEQP